MTPYSCGPFYHLVNPTDRIRAAKEILRVETGSNDHDWIYSPFLLSCRFIISAANNISQVDRNVFRAMAQEGIFQNKTEDGFQEGFCPTVSGFKVFWENLETRDVQMYSTRSFIHQNEHHLLSIRDHNPELFNTIVHFHREYSTNEAYIEAGGHALWSVEKPSMKLKIKYILRCSLQSTTLSG